MDGSVYFGRVSACGLSSLAAPVIFGSSPCSIVNAIVSRDNVDKKATIGWSIGAPLHFPLLLLFFFSFFLHRPPPRRIWRRRSHSILLEYVINRRQTSGFKPGWMMASLHHGFQALQLVLLNNYRSYQYFVCLKIFFRKSNKVWNQHF